VDLCSLNWSLCVFVGRRPSLWAFVCKCATLIKFRVAVDRTPVFWFVCLLRDTTTSFHCVLRSGVGYCLRSLDSLFMGWIFWVICWLDSCFVWRVFFSQYAWDLEHRLIWIHEKEVRSNPNQRHLSAKFFALNCLVFKLPPLCLKLQRLSFWSKEASWCSGDKNILLQGGFDPGKWTINVLLCITDRHCTFTWVI
jgi:hypothetical protein